MHSSRMLNDAVDDVDDEDVAEEEAEEINREALEQDAAKVQTPATPIITHNQTISVFAPSFYFNLLTGDRFQQQHYQNFCHISQHHHLTTSPFHPHDSTL